MFRTLLILGIIASLGTSALAEEIVSSAVPLEQNPLICWSGPMPNTPQPPAGELIGGSFEEPVISGPYQVFSSYGAMPHGWVIESGTVDIVGNYWEARKGKQSLDLSGAHAAPGTIYQDVRTEKGAWYLLRFAASGNPEPADQPTIKKLRVYFDGELLDELQFDVAGDDFEHVNWHYYKYKVKASGDVSRLKFQSLTESMCGPILDDVSMTPISPPQELRELQQFQERQLQQELTSPGE
ncbi:DUF642 domain-containing protein [Blastopirellula sp. JC732]|uniref:DUF642 domain-containing protein n=1 Tax=Blastopirellula sediminis TaxID=2894196 RepID=A0A9X1MI02_9BACT|nr:DUF642 domain-containing protein [Blastopirellula sediminis]MCC9607739.1 DUF642 domain-containing protein [Blastopirellula sediminis]MCC9627468.1 DUF642 domain-containing protein [Blastopirellula sediminis]